MRITKDAKKFIAKILVAVLIISMMPSFGVEVKAATASDFVTTQVTDGILYVTISGSVTAYLNASGVYIEDVGSVAVDWRSYDDNLVITASGGAVVKQSSYMKAKTVNIEYGSKFWTQGLFQSQSIINNGTFESSGSYNPFSSLTNNGTFIGQGITLDTSNITAGSGAIWQLSNTLTVSNGTGWGRIEVGNDTTITVASGASANIYIGSGTSPVTVTGPVTEVPAKAFNGYVYMNELDYTPFYVGTTYDMSNYAYFSGDYYTADDILFRYATSDGTALSEQPSTLGGYKVQAYINNTIYSDWKSFSITYYPVTSLAPTYTGINNTYYVKGDLTISPPDGWDIFISPLGTTDYTSRSSFSGYYVVGESYWEDNYGFRDAFCRFVKTSGENAGAITETISLSSLQNLIFDSAAPDVIQVTADGNDITFTNGMSIAADSVTVKVQDLYLERVLLSTEDVLLPVEEGDFKVCSVSYNAADGATKTCSFKAYDYAGNETTVSFTLVSFLSTDGLKLTLSGITNEKYVKDTVTVSAPEGYEIISNIGSGNKYASSIDFKKSDLYDGNGKFKSGLTFTFKRKSDGAVSKPVAWDKVAGQLDDVIFDDKDPVIYGMVLADGKGVSFKSGCTIDAYEVSLTVSDEYLEKVIIGKETIDRKNGVKQVGTDYRANLVFTVLPGETKEIKFTAYDLSGRATEYIFTLKGPKLVPGLEVKLADQFAGVAYTPAITTVSDGAKDVKYYYAENIKASVSANEFSETVPTMPGKYVVKAVIPETNKYLSATAYAEFSIAYLPTPENPYTLDGDMGENGYYKTDVLITPPAGYTICATLTGTYTKTLTYSAAIKDIYLKQTSTGALTGPVPFNETLKVDKTAPAISTAAKNQAGNVVDLSKLIYADKVTFTISDEHLSKVTINGQEVSFTDGKVTISLVCNGHKYYNIVAVDEAGNEYSFRVEMKATWLQSGIVPVGTLISLVPGEGVALEPGEFIIEDSDDTTVYNGGMEVYVSEETELTLIKVN